MASRFPGLRLRGRTRDRYDSIPVEGVHLEDLEMLLEGLRTAVALGARWDDAELPPDQRQNRDALLAHFAALDPLLERWNAAVELARITPGALWEWFARTASEYGITEPTFAVGSIIDRLAILTIQRARSWELDIGYEFNLEPVPEPFYDGTRICIHLESQRVATLPSEPQSDAAQRVRAASEVIQRLFDDAQASREARAIADARDAVLELKSEVLEYLADQRTASSIQTTKRCAICRERVALA
jgi:hypothetical protein